MEMRGSQLIGLNLVMKLTAVKMIVAGLVLSTTPNLAAPPEIEDFCFAQLEQVRPPLSSGRGDREAFIANCIAMTAALEAVRRRNQCSDRGVVEQSSVTD